MGKVWVVFHIVSLAMLLALGGCSGGTSSGLRLAPRAAAPDAPNDGVGTVPLSADLAQTLRELDSLALPDGVDAATFSALKTELRKLFTERATTKFVSNAPTSTRSRVTDFTVTADGGGARFHWSYRNEGDYNQDGVVDLADLAALALSLGKDTASPDWATARVADGNGNGKVEPSDVASIGVNYLKRVTRYSLQFSASPAPDAAWTQVADVAFTASTLPAARLRQFELRLPGAAEGYYAVTPCDGEDRGSPSGFIQWPLSAAGAWPGFGHDAQHSRQSPYSGPQSSKLKWELRSAGPGYSFTDALIGADGTVYIGSGADLHALNPDGTIKWHADGCYPKAKPVLAEDGTLYIASIFGLVAFNLDGTLKWTYSTQHPLMNSPILAPDGTIYISCEDDNKLYAIDRSGNLKWEFVAESFVYTPPQLAPDGTVYFGTYNGSLISVSPAGKQQWIYASGIDNIGPFVIGTDGSVYVYVNQPFLKRSLCAINPDGSQRWNLSGYNGNSPVFYLNHTIYISQGSIVFAIAENGEIKWSHQIQSGIVSFTASSNPDMIYVSAGDGLYAVNSYGGLKWSYLGDLDSQFYASAIVASDGSLYISNYYRGIYALTPGGKLKWFQFSDIAAIPIATGEDGTVFVKSNGKLFAVSPSGTVKWTYSSPAAIASSPAIAADGTVYVGCDDSKLYAVNADGSLKWTYTTLNAIKSSPAIGLDGSVYCAVYEASSNRLVLYATSSEGDTLWVYKTDSASNNNEGIIASSPVIGADGTIYIGSSANGLLYAINPDGGQKWSYDTSHYIYSSPAIGADGTVYIGSDYHALLAIKPDGSLKWQYSLPYPLSSPAIGVDGTIFIAGIHDDLYAINSDSSLKWSLAVKSGFASSPAVDRDGVVYAGSADGSMCAISPEGSFKWTYATDIRGNAGGIYSTPAIGADGVVYFGTGWRPSSESRINGHKFYAIRADGSLLWNCTTNDAVLSSPAIGADGTVYVGSMDGKLYAFGD